MALTKKAFSDYIKEFKFRELFNDMGWDNDRTTQPIVEGDTTFLLNGVASKSGFKIFLCSTAQGNLPDYNTRKKIEIKVTKLFQEHLIIFTDLKRKQIWQLVLRQSGKPSKLTDTHYNITQDPELLYQRASGLFFELDEEEHITIVDVTQRVADNFHQNNERVTKQFYDRFKQQHTAFLKFIKGFDDKISQEWYTSLMLNRLMFCYFIQKKGFLDNNRNYLSDKLKLCQERKGRNRFYSFYRNFLLQLFHQGLGAPDHSKALEDEIGQIPYLNGGLFDEHELEKSNKKIEIDDKAFESIFKFFNEWEWHLDTRHTASGKDINPDVIGYIFEKYINDRADMGAYYTKEEITDYISKNCILPFLFDEVKRQYSTGSKFLKEVRESGDRYIYESVKKGANEKLPKSIHDGIDNFELRGDWNKVAPEPYSLATEIWREVIDRRSHCSEIQSKISNGEVASINDFVTFNLNIRQFAIDSIANTDDPEWLKVFYKVLSNVTIIDPTCGSGAFLFAAMNILEELYEQCIQRMHNFVNDSPKGKYRFFEETIERIAAPEHPNLQYFIYKNIILRNLYGVDIMNEAVEIAKLRLFLKLVATVDADYKKPNLGLEPLPDIDFNIRSGNTLVGFANKRGIEYASKYLIDGADMIAPIEEKSEIVSKTFARYKEIQLSHGDDYRGFKKAKDELYKRLNDLNHELNLLLHKQAQSIKFDKWLCSHKPFHWFAEFYEIIHVNGGFDVVIGNPPYVEYSKNKANYTINNYLTEKCGNLYSYVMERSMQIINQHSCLGMIVPMSITSIRDYAPLRSLLQKRFKDKWITNHAIRPTALFDGISQRVSIFIGNNIVDSKSNWLHTDYLRTKPNLVDLFANISYAEVNSFNVDGIMPKIGSEIERQIFKKITSKRKLTDLFTPTSKFHLHFKDYGETYWIFPLDMIPYKTFIKSYKSLGCKDEISLDIAVICFNSSLFYWFYTTISDCWHFGKWHMSNFHFSIDEASKPFLAKASKLRQKLMNDYIKNRITRYDERVEGELYEYKINKSKSIIDELDKLLAEHYGFTDNELDFIINYDIKYRMGKDLEDENE